MRPPPSPRVSSRDQKLNQLASMQEADQRQQQLDQQATAQSASQGQAAQTGLLQMLTGLYGLQNEQELNPLKQGLIQAQTSGQNIENRFKPALYQAQTASEQNRGELWAREKTNDPKLAQYLDFVKTMAAGGRQIPDAEKYRSIDEYDTAQKGAAAQKNATNWGTTVQGVKTGSIRPEDPAVVSAWGPENAEYLKGIMPPAAPVKPPVGNMFKNYQTPEQKMAEVQSISPSNLIQSFIQALTGGQSSDKVNPNSMLPNFYAPKRKNEVTFN